MRHVGVAQRTAAGQPQRASGGAQRASGDPPRASGGAQSAPDGAQRAPDGAQRAPGGPQRASGDPRRLPGDPQIGADPLSPVRAALIRSAEQRAAELRATASAEAEAVIGAGRRQAEEVLSQARALGEQDGRSAAATRHAASRRAARRVVLTAQRDAYDDLRHRVRAAVCALQQDPVYPRLRGRLEEMARGMAGPAATITPHPSGGVVAEGSGTFVDCSLPRLADRAVDALGAEVSALWSG